MCLYFFCQNSRQHFLWKTTTEVNWWIQILNWLKNDLKIDLFLFNFFFFLEHIYVFIFTKLIKYILFNIGKKNTLPNIQNTCVYRNVDCADNEDLPATKFFLKLVNFMKIFVWDLGQIMERFTQSVLIKLKAVIPNVINLFLKSRPLRMGSFRLIRRPIPNWSV